MGRKTGGAGLAGRMVLEKKDGDKGQKLILWGKWEESEHRVIQRWAHRYSIPARSMVLRGEGT